MPLQLQNFTADGNGIFIYTGADPLTGDASQAINQNASTISTLITSLLSSSTQLGSYDASGAAAAVNTALTAHEADQAAHGATSANTANAIVRRGASGEIGVGAIDAAGNVEGGSHVAGVATAPLKFTNNADTGTFVLYGGSHPSNALGLIGTDSYGIIIQGGDGTAKYLLAIIAGGDPKIGSGGTTVFAVNGDGTILLNGPTSLAGNSIDLGGGNLTNCNHISNGSSAIYFGVGDCWIDQLGNIFLTQYDGGGNIDMGGSGQIRNYGLTAFADNATAVAFGLARGTIYSTATGELRVVV